MHSNKNISNFGGAVKLDYSGIGMDSTDAKVLAELLKDNTTVSELNVNSNAMGTTAAKAFGGMLPMNKTLKTLDVSNNSFGKMQVGDEVKLKSSGEIATVTYINYDNSVDVKKTDGSDSKIKPSEFEWESQVPAFCAGVAASQSLTSVSDFSCMY